MSASKIPHRIGGPLVAFVLLASFALAPSASAVPSRDGRWVGTTGQGEPFRFSVRHDQIMTVLTHVVMHTSGCDAHITERGRGLSIRIRDDGTFRAKLVNQTDRRDTLTITGEFTAPRRASGKLRAVKVGGNCDGSVSTTWKVTKQ